jgi:aryl-alcohol dehydrogenase-like predicted oxidoreductase
MKYRALGRTGLRVSVVGLGTWQFGGEWGKTFSQPEVDAILSTAQECGINLLDTAECYGDHLSEALIGFSINRNRQKWVIATKFGHVFHTLFTRSERWSPRDVQAQLEGSLRALQTDYVDLYQFHSGSNDVFDQDGLWEMLRKQVEAGKVRHLGISISKQTTELHQVGSAPAVGAETIQLVYNRLERDAEKAILPACQQHQLGVLARVPLASGYLSGKYRPGARFDKTDIRASHDAAEVEHLLRQVEEIQEAEVPQGIPMATWALGWVLQHPTASTVISGCKSPQQVRMNAEAADLDMVRE